MRTLLVLSALAVALVAQRSAGGDDRSEAIDAFATIQAVLQHPRCQNCHIEGDAPLVGNGSVPHPQSVVRGPIGHGAPGLPCSSCHGRANPPASYGPQAPPGAPVWVLPPPDQKMAWLGLSPAELCETIKDQSKNGGRDFEALIEHISEDDLVLWGWNPGGERNPVPIPHDEFVAKFKQWAAAGGPCPD